MVLIFPKNRLHSGPNNMHNIFLLLTQAAQSQLEKGTYFLNALIFNYLLASQVLSQLGHFTI